MAVTSVWKTVAVDMATGANPVQLTDATVESVGWTLNVADGADVRMATIDPAAAELFNPTREIQIWRDDQILFWGPVIRIEADRDTVFAQCAGAWWYLTRRHFGKADRTNLVVNGDFEAGAAGWAASGLTPVVDPFRAVEGHHSIRLTGTAADHNTYLTQTVTHAPGFHHLGDLLTLAAWVWVGSDDYTGPATDTFGLWVEHKDAAGTVVFDDFAAVDDTTPKDQWVRLPKIEIPHVLPDHTVEVRLYPPHGTAWWDLVTLTAMESLAFHEADLATILRGVVLYAQDRHPAFTHNKSDLGIGVDTPPTGVTVSKVWQFADHQNIADELSMFTANRHGVDLAVDVDDATTRTFRSWHPQKGVVRPDPLVYGANVVRFTWAQDRTRTANGVVVLGSGEGPDREEGGAAAAPVGPTLEDVTVAPDGTPPGALDQVAAERLAVVSNPEILEVTCVGLIGAATVGDWFPVTIDCDAVQIGPGEIYRAVKIAADPAFDTLTLTMNRQDPTTPEDAMARFPRAVDAVRAPGGGVWVVGSDGGVGAYNGAAFHGSLPDSAIIPNAPMVAIVAHGAGGYWLVAADTGIFAFGDAPTRLGHTAMIDTEYAAGDRAIIAAEPDADTLVLIADDGNTYAGLVP